MRTPMLTVVGFVLITACSGSRESQTIYEPGGVVDVPHGAVTAVTLNATSVQLVMGGSYQLTAKASDANGNVADTPVTWSAADSKVATVSSSGMVTAASTGTTIVTAVVGDKSAQCTVVVSAPAAIPVATVTVTLSSASLIIGQSTQATATA